jgi:outer membrane lipoprotein-sorting protein
MRSPLASLINAAAALVLLGQPATGFAQIGADAVEEDQEVDLQTLLAAFAAMPGLEATFVEEKHLGMLARPLTSTGTLYFTQPGLLHRRIDTPRPSTVVITPDTLRFSDESGTEEIDLRARADVRLFVESLVWILAGDQAALDATYSAEFTTEGSGWTLTLTPRRAPLSDVISALSIRGTELSVEEIRVDETAGDSTITRISDADPARTFDDAERTELFGNVGQ